MSMLWGMAAMSAVAVWFFPVEHQVWTAYAVYHVLLRYTDERKYQIPEPQIYWYLAGILAALGWTIGSGACLVAALWQEVGHAPSLV